MKLKKIENTSPALIIISLKDTASRTVKYIIIKFIEQTEEYQNTTRIKVTN